MAHEFASTEYLYLNELGGRRGMKWLGLFCVHSISMMQARGHDGCAVRAINYRQTAHKYDVSRCADVAVPVLLHETVFLEVCDLHGDAAINAPMQPHRPLARACSLSFFLSFFFSGSLSRFDLTLDEGQYFLRISTGVTEIRLFVTRLTEDRFRVYDLSRYQGIATQES